MSAEPVVGSSQLVFHFFARSFHPELFSAGEERQVWRDDYRAVFRAVESGYTVTFQSHRRMLTEAVLAKTQELPVQRRIASFSFARNPQKTFRYEDNIRYDGVFELKSMEPAAAEREIHHSVLRNGFMFRQTVPGCENDSILAISYVTGAGVLSVRTHRTFPLESTMLVTHSRWEVRY